MIHLDDSTTNEYLDSALPPSRRAEVDSHLAACAECAARLASLRALFITLDSLPDLPLERDLSAHVITAIIRNSALQARPAQPALTPALRLAFAFQAAIVLIALAAAIPFATQSIPTDAFTQLTAQATIAVFNLQSLITTQWTAPIESLRALSHPLTTLTTELPGLPMFSLTLCLAAVTVLWLVGNGVLLRPTSRVERR